MRNKDVQHAIIADIHIIHCIEFYRIFPMLSRRVAGCAPYHCSDRGECHLFPKRNAALIFWQRFIAFSSCSSDLYSSICPSGLMVVVVSGMFLSLRRMAFCTCRTIPAQQGTDMRTMLTSLISLWRKISANLSL